MGDVLEIWFELRSKCPDEYQPFVAKRAELLPIFYAANLLDHRYQGSKMNSVEIRLGVEYANLCIKDVAPDVSNYVAKLAPYSEFLFGENYSELSPAAW